MSISGRIQQPNFTPQRREPSTQRTSVNLYLLVTVNTTTKRRDDGKTLTGSGIARFAIIHHWLSNPTSLQAPLDSPSPSNPRFSAPSAKLLPGGLLKSISAIAKSRGEDDEVRVDSPVLVNSLITESFLSSTFSIG